MRWDGYVRSAVVRWRDPWALWLESDGIGKSRLIRGLMTKLSPAMLTP